LIFPKIIHENCRKIKVSLETFDYVFGIVDKKSHKIIFYGNF